MVVIYDWLIFMIGLESFQLKLKKQTPFQFQLRYANLNDLEQMVSIINEAYLVETFKTRKRTSIDELKEEFKDYDFIVIEKDDKILIASVQLSKKEKFIYFGMLAVDPKYQGYGFGFAIIQLIKEITKLMNLEYVELWVVHIRKELINYYQKLGFEKVGTEEWPKHLLHEVNQDVHFDIMRFYIK